jgi:thioredoxin-related protein
MKYIFLIFFLITSIFATPNISIKWLDNYHQARQVAKKENKNILLFISSKDNPYCDYMREDTLKYKPVIKQIYKKFIPVRLIIETDKIPVGIKFFTVPSIYLLTAKGKELKRIVGDITPIQMEGILKRWKVLGN